MTFTGHKPPHDDQMYTGKMQQNFKEIWLDVPKLEEHVMISNFGRVYQKLINRITAGTPRVGYQSVKINKKTYLIHRLVAEAFIPNPLKKPFINHKRGFKWLNWVTEIEWCTASENILHSYRVLGNYHPKDGDAKIAKISNIARLNIRHLYREKLYNQVQLAKIYGIGQNTVSRIILNKTLEIYE